MLSTYNIHDTNSYLVEEVLTHVINFFFAFKVKNAHQHADVYIPFLTPGELMDIIFTLSSLSFGIMKVRELTK